MRQTHWIIENEDLLQTIWGEISDVPFGGFSTEDISSRELIVSEEVKWRNDVIQAYQDGDIDSSNFEFLDPNGGVTFFGLF